MRAHLPPWLVILLLEGCVSFDEYTPAAGEAWIEDGIVPSEKGSSVPNTLAQVTSIEGRRLQHEQRVKVDSNVVLPLPAGPRKLEIQVCEIGFYKYCGRAVVLLDAVPGTRYRLHGALSKKRGYAEISIEDATTGSTVIKPMRVMGLTSTM